MRKYFWENKRLFILYLMITPCMSVSSVFFSKSLEPLFNGALLSDGGRLLRAVAAFFGFGMLDMLFYYCHKVIRENLRCHFLIAVKRDTFAGILNMDYSEYRSNPPAYYISLFQRDIKRINEDYFDSVCGIYRVIMAFSINFLVLIFYNPWICVMNVAVAALSVLVPKIFEKRIKKFSEEATGKAAEFQTILSDILLGFNTIRLFSVTGQIKRQMDKRNVNNETTEKARIVANFSYSFISMFFTQIGYIATIIVGVMMAYYGKMTIGAVVAVSQLIGGILAPFEELPVFFTNIKSVQNVKEKVLSYLNREEKTVSETGRELGEAAVELNGVVVQYEGKTALDQVSTVFEQNKKYILMGESGSGKSTLAKAILKMVPVHSGEIRIGNNSIDGVSESLLYRTVNYMQQEVFLFDDTIYNNITLYKTYPQDRVDKAIEDAGLKEYVETLKDGVYSVINGNGYQLSGGQKQRIGIARSLLAGAKVLVLDEITSSLDVVLGKKIEDVVFGLKDVTVIWISHKFREETMRKADEIIVLKDGSLKEKGSYEELMAQKGLFYSYQTISG